MDSYDVLGVSKESSNKEIEIAYEDLKRKYDPSFNTSTRAYHKYREVIKAYEDIKNDIRRKMYDLKDSETLENKEEKEYRLFDYNSEKTKKEDIKVDYNNLEQVDEIVKEDIVVSKRVSYLYYLLNLKIDVEYLKRVMCKECSSFTICNSCDGKGVVFYKEKQVYCPICHGSGKVSERCDKCNEDGYYLKEEKVSFCVDNESMTFSDLGNEYYDFSKSSLVINFDFYYR